MSAHIRQAEPGDYGFVIRVIDDWWGGREVAAMLQKLFFVHFRDTSFVAEDDSGRVVGFLCGFRSQSFDDEAYIHFVGVDPGYRGAGLARSLYERFFEAVAPRPIVRAVTSPVNEQSVLQMATGESLAHLNCLIPRGQVSRTVDQAGVAPYQALV